MRRQSSKGDKTIFEQKMETHGIQQKAKWINSMKKELQSVKESPKTNIHINSLRATLKKISNWKTPGHQKQY